MASAFTCRDILLALWGHFISKPQKYISYRIDALTLRMFRVPETKSKRTSSSSENEQRRQRALTSEEGETALALKYRDSLTSVSTKEPQEQWRAQVHFPPPSSAKAWTIPCVGQMVGKSEFCSRRKDFLVLASRRLAMCIY